MVKYIFLCAFIGLSVLAWSEIPIKRGPGIVAESNPELARVYNQMDISFDGNTFSPFKKITATVRVVEKDRYFFNGMSHFSPYDILVSWGQASDQKNLDYINFKLKDRSYSYNKLRLPLSANTINSQTELWHLVSSTENIERELFGLRKGHIITISGYLVDVTTKEGLSWNSSSSPSKITRSGNKHDILWITSLTKK
mgnify:FL=1|tara:strand:+ start:776 stop:1366 length:591 start_codon:yes stop_codon:yes gene_type:complete